MGDDKKYSIISMNVGDEEETVIQAGIAPSPSEEEAPLKERNEDAVDAFGPLEDQAEEGMPPAASEEALPVKADDGYRETTMEDLKSSGPFPKIRIAILICAALAAVVVILYYIFVS